MNDRDVLQAQMMAKSTGIAAILTLFFGGIGLLYATFVGGIIGTIIEIVFFLGFFVVGFATAGLGMLVAIPVYLVWHIICVILAIVLVNSHNKRLLRNLDDKSASANAIAGE